MFLISSPEESIIKALVKQLTSVCNQVLLGYSATGVEEALNPPAILIQLDAISETERQGARAKFHLQLTVSVVVTTCETTTYDLIEQVRSVRSALNSLPPIDRSVRQLTFSETQFDIAPGHGQLSFADIVLIIEVVA